MEAFLLSCVSSSDPQVIESANLAEDLLGFQGITTIEILVHRIKSSTLSYPDFENYLSSVGFGIGHIGKIRYKVKQMVMDLEDKELELLVSGAMYGDSPSSQTITDRGDTTANPLAHGAAAGGSAEKSPQEQLAEAQIVSGAMYGDSPSSQTITDRGDTTANPLAHGAAAGGSAEKSPQEQLAEAQKVMMNKKFVSVEFAEEGPLGVTYTWGHETDGAITVKSIHEGEQASSLDIAVDDELHSIHNGSLKDSREVGVCLTEESFYMVIEELKPRPLQLTFRRVRYQNEYEIETALTNIWKKYKLEKKYDDDSAYAMKRCRKTCDFLDLKKSAYMCVHNYISTMVFFAIMTGSQKGRGTAGRNPLSTQLYALYGDDNDKEDEDDDEYTNTTSASPHSLLYAPFIFVHSLL